MTLSDGWSIVSAALRHNSFSRIVQASRLGSGASSGSSRVVRVGPEVKVWPSGRTRSLGRGWLAARASVRSCRWLAHRSREVLGFIIVLSSISLRGLRYVLCAAALVAVGDVLGSRWDRRDRCLLGFFPLSPKATRRWLFPSNDPFGSLCVGFSHWHRVAVGIVLVPNIFARR